MNPIPNNEKERLEALNSYHIMDSLSEQEFNAITKLAASICGVPIALISLLDENRQWFKAKFGIDVDDTPRNLSFCQHAIMDNKIFEVENALENPLFKENPLVTKDPDIRFYAGAPLTDPNGFNLGTLCVIDRVPKKLTDDQKDALETLADEVVSLILLRKSKKDLEKSNNEIEAMLSGLQEGIVFQNTEGAILRCNKSAESILGLTYDQMIGRKSVDPTWRAIHEDGSDFPGNTHPAMVTLATKEPMTDVIMGVHKPNDELTWISVNAVPIFSNETKELTGVVCTFKDVTDSKLQQDKIKQNEINLKEAQEISKLGSWEFDLKTHELTWSSEHYRIFEIEEPQSQENLYKLYRSKIHPDDIEALDLYINRSIEEGVGFEYNHRVICENSEIKYVLGIGKVIFNINNEPIKVKGTVQDITERKIVENKIKISEERLNEAQQLAKIGNWEFNLKTSELYWSNELYHIFEIPIDTSKDELYSIYRSRFNDNELADLDEKISKCSTEGIPYENHHQIAIQNGEVKYILGRGFARKNEQGEIISLFGTAQDITQQKKAENLVVTVKTELQNFFDLSNDFMCIANVDGTFKTVNKTFEKTLGYSAEELENIPFVNFIHPDDLEITYREIEKLSQGHFAINFENRYRCKDNSYIWLSWRTAPDVKTGNLYATARDVSEEKKIKEELISSKDRAELASIAKSDFLANMSHEIRTPLNGIIGFSELLKTTELNQTQEIYSNTIVQSANSLLSVINDILDFSKIEAGKLELDIQKNQITDTVSEAIDIVTYQAQSKKLDLILKQDFAIPCDIYYDSIRLKQICVNLLGNAIKFTKEGGVELAIELISKHEKELTLRFSVSDTGVGISKELQTKIFDAFSQADTSTTRKYGGTGLGLSISNKLLDLMGNSKLNLISEEGKGSTFYFDLTLPYDISDAPKREFDFSSIQNVLIIDDSIKSSEVISEFLNHFGIQSVSEVNEEKVIEKINTQKFDALFIDSKNNSDERFELIKTILSNPIYLINSFPIIYMTDSIHDDSTYNKCHEIGVNYRLLKPIKPKGLFEQLIKLSSIINEKPILKKRSSEVLSKDKSVILVVDDNEINRLLAKTMLINLLPNTEIIEAKNGEEAIEKFSEYSPHLVLMDVQMPVLNGYDATMEIRKLPNSKNIPIVALTAGTIKGEREKCLEAGMSNYISKPIIKEELKDIILIYLLD